MRAVILQFLSGYNRTKSSASNALRMSSVEGGYSMTPRTLAVQLAAQRITFVGQRMTSPDHGGQSVIREMKLLPQEEMSVAQRMKLAAQEVMLVAQR